MREKATLTFVLLFLVALIVLPLFVVFLLSIVPRWSTAFPTSFSLEWWTAILKPKFMKIVINTLIVSIFSTGLTVGYGILAAYLFAFYEFRGKQLLLVLILSPTYVSGIVIALGLLTAYPYLRNTVWIMVLGHFIIISPVVFRYVLSSMVSIPPILIETSYVLGASPLRTLYSIILPLSKQGIIAGTILSIGMTISELSVSLLLFGPEWVTLSIQIYLERGWGTLGIAGVLSTILICLALLTTFIVNYMDKTHGRN